MLRSAFAQRLLDLTLTTLGLPILLPIMAGVAAGTWVSLGRPLVFAQRRIGRGEQPFTLYKFRTLPHADAPPTRFGRWLRRTRLDELPQLLNVLRGEMSLVGPRPLLPRYLPHFTAQERLRFAVRPGLTGWAQLRGDRTTPWDERFALDAWYVQHRSVGLDLYILLATPVAILRQTRVAGPEPPDFDAYRQSRRPEQVIL